MLSIARHENSPCLCAMKKIPGKQGGNANAERPDRHEKPRAELLQEVIRQAPAEYVTIGWLTSTLHRHSFGIIMLSLGLLATTPVGSSIPGLILAVMAVEFVFCWNEPGFPPFFITQRLPGNTQPPSGLLFLGVPIPSKSISTRERWGWTW